MLMQNGISGVNYGYYAKSREFFLIAATAMLTLNSFAELMLSANI